MSVPRVMVEDKMEVNSRIDEVDVVSVEVEAIPFEDRRTYSGQNLPIAQIESLTRFQAFAYHHTLIATHCSYESAFSSPLRRSMC
jgi:hypothetical protein